MKRYGLIGYPLSHSFSKKYFTEKFLNENIDAEFINFSIPSVEEFLTINKDIELSGVSVTIPYKKKIIAYLDEVSNVVASINACNCIQYKNRKLVGHNTDVIGFEKSFAPLLQSHHTKALVLGTGGASAAVEYVLQKLNIEYKFVSRTKAENNFTYNELTEQIVNQYTVIINASPVGTYPNVDEAPLLPYQFINNKHYLYDLVYNPSLTKFLQFGQQRNAIIKNGYDMLVLQAEENWEIWNE